jgi:hypothetical protein
MDEWRHGGRGKGPSMDPCLRRGLRKLGELFRGARTTPVFPAKAGTSGQ